MASKAFEAAVKAHLAPRLSDHGFVRRGIRYVRARPPWGVQGIEVQQDKWNGSRFCRFTINLVRSPKIGLSRAGLVERGLQDKRLFDLESMGQIERIGRLTEIRQDYWYPYDPNNADDIANSLNEALNDIEIFGLKWLKTGLTPRGGAPDKTRALAAEARWQDSIRQFKAELDGKE